MQNQPYSLIAELKRADVDGNSPTLPPIHLWHPESSKDIDMEIRANGTWYYLGTPIERPRLVKLFASVMRLEGEDYYLVTPVEKCRIKVEDAPFLIVLMDVEEGDEDKGPTITFTSNMGEQQILSQDNPLRIDPAAGEGHVYINMRDGLEARLNRSVYYQLAERLEEQVYKDEPWHGVRSQDAFFPLIRSSDI